MESSMCPCTSGSDYDKCCEPVISGQRVAKTAEELMRARYSAFAKEQMEFIEQTHDPKTISELDMKGNREWAKSAEWLGMEILSTEKGGEDDKTGLVEFRAKYRTKKGDKTHHELSEFNKRDGKWFFTDGRNPDVETFVRDDKKVGRNDPCVCGSGKKFKKCCGAS